MLKKLILITLCTVFGSNSEASVNTDLRSTINIMGHNNSSIADNNIEDIANNINRQVNNYDNNHGNNEHNNFDNTIQEFQRTANRIWEYITSTSNCITTAGKNITSYIRRIFK